MLQLQELRSLDVKLLPVVLFLVVVDLMAEHWIILKVIFWIGELLEFLLESCQRVWVVNKHLSLWRLAVVPIHLISILSLRLFVDDLCDDILLVQWHLMYVDFQTLEVHLSTFREVVRHYAETILVNLQEHVDSALADGQARHVGKEIVADEETQEDEVINDSFQVVSEGYFDAHEG